MTAVLLPLLVAVPLLSAGALVVVGERRRAHTATLVAVLSATFVAAVALAVHFGSGATPLATGVGQWPVGIAIPFAADALTAIMLAVTSLLSLASVAFAVASDRASTRYFAPLMLVLIAGVNGALLTADLFNLFVFIEVMLVPSYGLFVLAGPGAASLRQVAGARLYVVVNLLTSTIFLIGVAFVYGTAGSVNLADLAGAAQEDSRVALAVAVCLIALGIKAAVVPVHGWIARAYPATSPAITALFSGLHTKVAIYAIVRIYAVIFDGDTRYLWVGAVVFGVTMLVGAVAAAGASTLRESLTFSMVSGIGTILLGMALFTQAGLAAAIFYLVHHMIVKTSLFLSTGAIEVRYGTGVLGRVTGLAKREPVLAAAFLVAALSLAGLPPFSGFVAKVALVWASLDAGQGLIAALIIVASLVTLVAMLRIWAALFWSTPPGPDLEPIAGTPGTPSGGRVALAPASSTRTRVRAALAAPAVVLAALTVVLGLAAEPLLALSETAATGLLDTSAYVEAVSTP
jgi:multicomponent Na+:H+ antiporter subunit D